MADENGKDCADDKCKKKKKGLLQKAKENKGTTALWLAVVTALGSTGIPKIVELLENKPSMEQVQTLVSKRVGEVSKQVEDVSAELNKMIDALKEGHVEATASLGELQELRRELAGLHSRSELLQDVLRDCCTRRSVVRRLEGASKPAAMGVRVETMGPPPLEKKKAVEMLNKVPDFKVQQQLTLEELKK